MHKQNNSNHNYYKSCFTAVNVDDNRSIDCTFNISLYNEGSHNMFKASLHYIKMEGNQHLFKLLTSYSAESVIFITFWFFHAITLREKRKVSALFQFYW